MPPDVADGRRGRRVVMVSASEMRTDARVCREAESLSRAGYDVTLVCLASTPPAAVPGVTLKELPGAGGWRPVRLLLSLLRISAGVLAAKGDIYHAHNVHVLPAAWLVARLRRAKLVYDAHELFSVSPPRGRGGGASTMQRLERIVERLLAPKADVRITASRRYAAQIASALRIEPPLAVPNYPVLPPVSSGSRLRERVGATDDEIVILYQGGFYRATRAIDIVIRAMELLPGHYKLVLLGFGTAEEVAGLHEVIEELHLSSRVAVLPSVSHRELAEYTAGADVGVIPFRLQTTAMQLCSPNKLYEYMAASVPVLASAAEELKEVLEETGCGLTYDYDDPADLAKQTLALGPDRGALRRIGEAGRRAAEAQYCWQVAEHLLVDAYCGLDGSAVSSSQTKGKSPRGPRGQARLLVLAPFGVSNEHQLEMLSNAVGVAADAIDIVVRAGRPSLSATKAGARVVAVDIGRQPRRILALGSDALRIRGMGRRSRAGDPCVWLDRGWSGPYELLMTGGLRVLGIHAWRLVSPGGIVEARTSKLPVSALWRVLADNLVSARMVTRAAEQLEALQVPDRSRRPIRRALYMRLDLPLAVSPEPGGSLSHSEGIIGGLQDAGVKVRVVAPIALAAAGRPAPRMERVDFAPPVNLHPELAEAQFNRDIARQLQDLDLADVDFVYERYALFGSAGLELAHRLGVPYVLEANASEVRFRRQYDSIRFGRSAERFERNLFEAASLVLAVSQRVVADIKEIAPRARVLLVPNGVDPKLFVVDETGRSAVRAGLGFGPGDVVVGFVGRFYAWHGVQTLAEAAQDFLERNPRISLLLVGDGDLREIVERALAPWPGRVRFTGLVPHSDVPVLMSACDILLSPHAPMKGFIGSPMKIFEYLASGGAVVASRLEQIADVIDDGVTGVLVEPGNAEELVAAVLRLADSPELRDRLGSAGRSSALAEHAWSSKVRSVLAHVGPEPAEGAAQSPASKSSVREDMPRAGRPN